jgi:hypothetical protein
VSKATIEVWNRSQKKPELREAFSNIPRLLEAIKHAKFCHEADWFTVESLFSKDSQRVKYKVIKLLSGEYDNGNGNGKPKQAVGPGQRHPEDANRSGI